jgi:putative tributyrin esterase
MAVMRCEFFSEVLEMSTSMTVILPQVTTRQIGMTGSGEGEVPVLYLLHGLSDDDTTWCRRTSIERYAAPLGLAVVMPQVQQSFYADEVMGLRYWTFLSEELPTLVDRFFRTSTRREETFVAGLSMGGYGAMKWALREPHRFAAAASLSGALGLSDSHGGNDPWFRGVLDRAFGRGAIDGTGNDVMHLIQTADTASLPRLYVGCGTEDFLYAESTSFIDAARAREIDLTVSIGPGDHEWDFWDAEIQRVLTWLPLQG